MSLPSIAGTKRPQVARHKVNESPPLTRAGHNDTLLEVLKISRSAHERSIGKPERRALEAGFIDALCSGRKSTSLLGYRRRECIEQIHWSLPLLYREHFKPYASNCLEILECWSYDGVTTVERDHNFRLARLDDDNQPGKPYDFNARLWRWLKTQCAPRMTLNRDAFEPIEAEFDLHEETIPAFLREGGSYLMHKVIGQNGETTKVKIVLKVMQHMEISNCLLSLTYDVARNWMDAFICGDGIVFERICDRGRTGLGRQQEQVVAPLISTPDLWTNPLLLPAVVLHACETRMVRACQSVRKRSIEVEDRVGVTWGESPHDACEQSSWPLDIDVGLATRELHSLLHRIQLLLGISASLSSFASWLLETEYKMVADPSLMQKVATVELRGSVENIASGIDSLCG
ncbi:hypothetical protein A1O7_03967 [Cladophialophora yegresii CBS 114405]|uniref:Uncharacterized protein n=1 Tax=Cladophialophora yegresii CBS 114405 TaxID=1182544 RepID=W9W474_9EURO|nr:uncharacterized protein A1O7_03967 [Cladophialophora yegresii CBS 114405]EXJ59820.1 hypothetical protein A1O7_03967 [Cladophialophora yegresii CBS 114405]